MIKTMQVVNISKIIEMGTFVCQYGMLQANYAGYFDEGLTIHDVFGHHGVVALLLFIRFQYGKL